MTASIYERMMADRAKRRSLVAYELAMESTRLCAMAAREGWTKEDLLSVAGTAWDNMEETLVQIEKAATPAPESES